MDKQQKGKLGEELAVTYLQQKGFSIKRTRYYSRYGEIDIIAADCDYIIFVEVKARSAGGIGTPREAVDRRKQQKIIKTALTYLSAFPETKQPRFDVIEILFPKGRSSSAAIHHIENAFEGQGYF